MTRIAWPLIRNACLPRFVLIVLLSFVPVRSLVKLSWLNAWASRSRGSPPSSEAS